MLVFSQKIGIYFPLAEWPTLLKRGMTSSVFGPFFLKERGFVLEPVIF
jgi:hypothetical protein